ncbi:cytochrome c biogenesis protein ResB [Desulfoscipio sp. XC116]|uniref:cytochrome c biogenesis protein ResB n=1 Tax=Desulfoscipio sp. XC116 TaxID=3144975 RepID=UPI00325AB500
MGAMRRIYKFISSMQTGLSLLFMIGVASAAGASLLPGTFFKAPLFRLLLLLLLLNMIFCTVNRLQSTYRILLKRPSRVWLRQTGTLLLHLGIILVLLGGAMYAVRGQDSRIQLFAGDRLDISQVLDIKHPFTVRLNKFRIDFNKDGSPSQYISEVSVLEHGRKIKDVPISVNNPLHHAGVKVYQGSFGYSIKAKYTDKSGARQTGRFMAGDLLEPANTNRVVKIYRYIPHFNPVYGIDSVTMRPDNPHIIFSVYEGDKLLGIGAAKFGEPACIDEDVYLVFSGVEPYTILQVKSDPGLPLAMVGGMVLMLGICLAIPAAPVKRNLVVNDL